MIGSLFAGVQSFFSAVPGESVRVVPGPRSALRRHVILSALVLGLHMGGPTVLAAPNPTAQSALNESLGFIDAGRLPDALTAIKKSLAADPSSVEAHLLYIRLMIDTKQRAAVTAEYAKRKEQKGDGISILLHGRTLESADAQLAAYKKALEVDPKLGWAQYSIASVYMQQNKLDLAVTSLESAIRIDPGFTQAMESLGTLHLLKREPDKAIARYAQVVGLNPGNAKAWYQLGSLQGRKGETDKAVASLEKARALAPNNIMVLNNLAFLYLKQKRFDDALAAYDAVLKQDPGFQEARTNREVVVRVKSGAVKFEAIAAMEKAMSATDPNEAIAAYRRVIEISPNFDLPWLAMAQLMAATSRPADAEKAYMKAVELNPTSVETARLIAEFYLFSGQAHKAEGPLARAIQASPKEPQLFAALGLVYLRTERPEEAEKAFNTAITLLPPSETYPLQINRARAQFMGGKHSAAIETLKAILLKLPAYNAAKLELGTCYFALEQFDTARKYYKEVLADEKNNKDVAALLKAVDEKQAEFTQKSKDHLRARQIVLKTDAEAQAVLKALQEGGEFTSLARKKSVSPEGREGGDLGFFKPGELKPEVERAIVALKPGQLSGVVKTSMGYHIFKRLN